MALNLDLFLAISRPDTIFFTVVELMLKMTKNVRLPFYGVSSLFKASIVLDTLSQ